MRTKPRWLPGSLEFDMRSIMLRLGSVHAHVDGGTHAGWCNCPCEFAEIIRAMEKRLITGKPLVGLFDDLNP